MTRRRTAGGLVALAVFLMLAPFAMLWLDSKRVRRECRSAVRGVLEAVAELSSLAWLVVRLDVRLRAARPRYWIAEVSRCLWNVAQFFGSVAWTHIKLWR